MASERLQHLIDAEELVQISDRGDVRIVDCRWYLEDPDGGLRDYHEAHIPGAVYASLDDVLSGRNGPGRHPLPEPAAFSQTLSRLGISPETSVVAYDQRGGAIASRLWWMLTAQGHRSVAVLDGGMQAWEAAGCPLETTVEDVATSTYPCSAWTGVATLDDVATCGPERTVVDARAPERYRGEHEPVDPVAGHIPGAMNLPIEGNLTPSLRFRSANELRDRYAAAGLTDGASVISQCGSGVTACITILAMEIAGLGRPDLYVGSWSEWGGSGMPVATADTP